MTVASRPKLAPSRKKMEPVWLNVGTVDEEFDGWWFAIRPTVSLELIMSLWDPINYLGRMQMTASGAGVGEQDSEKVRDFILEFGKNLAIVAEGLSKILIDWNFIDEVSGDKLPSPAGNPEIIKQLDLVLLMHVAILTVSAMSGSDPNFSRTPITAASLEKIAQVSE